MSDRSNDPTAPKGYATINPFIVADDASGLIEFLKEVFGATERPEARTLDGDGLLLHAELAVGDTTVMFADRKPDWPFTPSLLQVYVDDVETTLDTARRLDAAIVTEPTEFFGDVFSRFRDPWSNLWWVYHHRAPAPDAEDGPSDWSDDGTASDGDRWDETSPELEYIHDTLLTGMAGVEDPRLPGSGR
jgi:uncharacterized glyoxalase superfamily protein PhnB